MHNWIKIDFKDLVDNITDRIDKPEESGIDFYVGLDQIDSDEIRIKRFASTSDVKAQKFLCKKGDIIFGKRNAYLRKCAICDRNAVVSAHSMVIRHKGNLIIKSFLPWLMQSSIFWKIAQSISEGSMSPTIKWKNLAKQKFMIPPKPEQENIAKVLWSIEDNVEKTEKLIEVTEQVNKNIFKELLTKGIDHKELKYYPEIEMEIPKEWNLIKLKHLTKIIRDGTHFTPKYINSGIPFLRVTDIQTSQINWDNVKYISLEEHNSLIKRVKPEKGDILLSKNGTIGITKIVDWDREFSIFVSICLIRPDLAKIRLKYLYYFLTSDLCISQIKFRSKQGTVTNLHLEEIKEFQITLPSLNEQDLIVSKLEVVDSNIDNLRNHLVSLKELRKKMLNELLSGELRVPEGARL